MRLLIGSQTYPLFNGVTTSINLSIDGLVKRGHQVTVVGPTYQQGIVRPEHRVLPSSWTSELFLKAFNKKERLMSIKDASLIKEISQSTKAQVMWLHSLTAVPNAFELAMKKLPVKKLLTYHTLVEDYGRIYAGSAGAWLMRERSQKVANLMDAVITPSHVIAKKLISYGVTKPIHVVPTGISIPANQYSKAELAARFNFDPKATVLVYVGRVSAEKNIQGLLDALVALQGKGNYVLMLIGPGDVEETKRQATKFGVVDSLVCTGALPKEEAQRCYGGADFFVFASQTETQGLVIGEAMLADLPVVAFDSPIQPEVYPSSIAHVVKDASEMAVQIDKIAHNNKLRLRQVKAAKKFVQDEFSLTKMIDRQEKLLENLISD